MVDRCGNRDDIDIAFIKAFDGTRKSEEFHFFQFLGLDLPRDVDTAVQFVDACAADIEAYCVELLAKFNCEREADVAKPDNADARFTILDFAEHWL